MEQNRELRFLIPPLVFLAALGLGAAIDPQIPLLKLLTLGPAENSSRIFSLALAGGVLIVTMGFVISAIAIFLLRIVFFIIGRRPGGYEVAVPQHALLAIWNALKCSGTPEARETLSAVAAYSHSVLPTRLNDWAGRRWNTFMVSINSAVAIGLAHLIGVTNPWYPIAQVPGWIVPEVTVASVLLVNGSVAWYQAGRFVAFVSERIPLEKAETNSELNVLASSLKISFEEVLRVANASLGKYRRGSG